jgi:hypothetical protein
LARNPSNLPDRFGDASVVGSDHLTQLFGIEAGRQRGRVGEVAEHHRQLPPLRNPWLPLGVDGRWFRQVGRRVRFRGPQSGNRRKQSAAVADRADPETDKIVGRQLRQQFRVDVVLAEGPLVLLEPQASQPNRDVHRNHPGSIFLKSVRSAMVTRPRPIKDALLDRPIKIAERAI